MPNDAPSASDMIRIGCARGPGACSMHWALQVNAECHSPCYRQLRLRKTFVGRLLNSLAPMAA